jgi:hypothetical protein
MVGDRLPRAGDEGRIGGRVDTGQFDERVGERLERLRIGGHAEQI